AGPLRAGLSGILSQTFQARPLAAGPFFCPLRGNRRDGSRADGLVSRAVVREKEEESGGPSRNRTGEQGFAVLCVTAPPSGLVPSPCRAGRGAPSEWVRSAQRPFACRWRFEPLALPPWPTTSRCSELPGTAKNASSARTCSKARAGRCRRRVGAVRCARRRARSTSITAATWSWSGVGRLAARRL